MKAAVFLIVIAHGAALAASSSPVPVTALAFSPDGSVLVSNGARSLDIRSPTNGEVQSRMNCDLPRITSLAFQASPGRLLAVSGGEPGVRGETRLLDWQTQKVVQQFTNSQDLATSVAFGSDGTLLGIASADHLARVWQRSARTDGRFTNLFTLSGHAGPVLAIAFSPTGRTIVTASADRSMKVWSVDDGRLLRTFTQHLEAVNALSFRPLAGGGGTDAGSFCASGSTDRSVRIWQPEIGRMVRIIRQHRGAIFALAYASDGKSLFSGGQEGVIRRFEADSDNLVSQWPAHSDWNYSLAVSPDGTRLASGDWNGEVKIHDLSITR